MAGLPAASLASCRHVSGDRVLFSRSTVAAALLGSCGRGHHDGGCRPWGLGHRSVSGPGLAYDHHCRSQSTECRPVGHDRLYRCWRARPSALPRMALHDLQASPAKVFGEPQSIFASVLRRRRGWCTSAENARLVDEVGSQFPRRGIPTAPSRTGRATFMGFGSPVSQAGYFGRAVKS